MRTSRTRASRPALTGPASRFRLASGCIAVQNRAVVYDDEDAGLEQETALVKAAPVELAWDKNGRRFPVPKNAHAWRVLRKPGGGRGRPAVVSTPSGPL